MLLNFWIGIFFVVGTEIVEGLHFILVKISVLI